jgi:hypothetical protein
MILQDKTTGGKKILIEGDEITLESLRDNANYLCKPNVPLNLKFIYFNKSDIFHIFAFTKTNKL